MTEGRTTDLLSISIEIRRFVLDRIKSFIIKAALMSAQRVDSRQIHLSKQQKMKMQILKKLTAQNSGRFQNTRMTCRKIVGVANDRGPTLEILRPNLKVFPTTLTKMNVIYAKFRKLAIGLERQSRLDQILKLSSTRKTVGCVWTPAKWSCPVQTTRSLSHTIMRLLLS